MSALSDIAIKDYLNKIAEDAEDQYENIKADIQFDPERHIIRCYASNTYNGFAMVRVMTEHDFNISQLSPEELLTRALESIIKQVGGKTNADN